jgi:high affinity Mn2+ porin
MKMRRIPTLLMLAILAVSSAFAAEAVVTEEGVDSLRTEGGSLNKTSGADPAAPCRWYDRIDIALGATGIVQGSSGAGDLSADGDVTDASGSIDLELTGHATEDGALYVHLESGAGDGLDGDIATLSGLNGDADDDSNVRLTEVWYEQTFGESFRVRAGKVDLTSDFDTSAVANDETSQFLSGGFVNNLAIEFPDDNGFGGMFWVSPSKLIDVGLGVADADADWDNAFEDPFAIAEIDFKPCFGCLQGNYRVYAWYNGKDHENFSDGSADDHNHGFGVSFDQQVSDIVTLFARYGVQRSEVAQVGSAWSAGFSVVGSAFGRENDSIGFAYGMAMIGDDWKNIDAASGVDSANEGHFEVFYNLAINDHLNLTPDVQFVTNANGDSACDDFFAFGVRAQVSF